MKDGWKANGRRKNSLSSKVMDSLKVKGENIQDPKKTKSRKMSFLAFGQSYSVLNTPAGGISVVGWIWALETTQRYHSSLAC